MKYILFILIFSLVSVISNAQGWMWAKQFTGVGQNIPVSLVTDASGNNYVYGIFNSTVNQDAFSLTSSGPQDIYFAKYDKQGQILWLKQFGGTASETALSISLSKDGNFIYLLGFTNSNPCIFDGNNLATTGLNDIFLAKYALDGTLQWIKNIAYGADHQYMGNFEIDANNNIIIAGHFLTSVTFYGNTTTLTSPYTGIRQGFISKFDQNGNLIWAKMLQCDNSSNTIRSVNVDNTGYYFSGISAGNFNFDIGSISSTGYDGFLYKTDLNGIGLWVRKINGSGNETLWKHKGDSNGNQYLTGYFNSPFITVDSITNVTSKVNYYNLNSGTNDFFLVKYNQNGTLQWVKTMGTINDEVSYNLDIKNNNTLITGSFNGNISFDNLNLTTTGVSDAFIVECNSAGQFISAQKIGGKANDVGKAGVYSSTGRNFVTAGEFYSDTLTIGTNQFINPSIYRDSYIAKYGCFDSTHFTITPMSCIDGGGIPSLDGAITATPSDGNAPYVYLWSNNATTTTISNLDLGIYTCTVTGTTGCTLVSSATVTLKPVLQASITNIVNVICSGQSTGSATVTATLGNPPYSYLWNTGVITATISNKPAGTYSVTVSDQCLNTVITSATITSNPAVNATISGTNITCRGGNNGIATVSPFNGSLPYTYIWKKSGSTTTIGTTLTISTLTSGTYNVTVTDACTNSVIKSITLTQPAALAVGILVVPSSPCANTGQLTAVPSNGTSPYTYKWNTNPVRTTQTITGLVSGNYTVTVTDACGATKRRTATVSISSITVAITTTSVLCNGGNTGTASAAPSGGTPGYTYLWSNGQTTSTATGLNAGNYSVTVRDVYNCSKTASVTVAQPTVLASSIPTHTNVSCYSGNNGSATVAASGGTPSYTYIWSNGQTTASATSLIATIYTVTVTDNKGCTSNSSVTITQPTQLTSSIPTHTNVSCYGGGNGSATVSPSGGTPTYSYLWSNSQTGIIATGLSAVTYTVTVTDNKGCTSNSSVTITQLTQLTSSIPTYTNVYCRGGNTGSATVSPSGGTPTYTYLWSNSQTGITAANLSAGTYNITITDNNSCTSTSSITITQPAALSVGVLIIPTSPCANTGQLTAVPSNGTSPYTYKWNTNPVRTTQTITGLASGNYTVTVTDACGATKRTTSSVNTNNITITSTANCSSPLCNGSATANVTGGDAPYTYLWNNGQTTQTATNLCSGTYRVTVTDVYGCTKRKTNITVGACLKSMEINVTENTIDEQINIFPNPASSFLTINFASKDNTLVKLEIYNLLGECVLTETFKDFSESTITKDISSFTNGLYLLKLTLDEKEFTRRVVIQK